MHVAHGFLIRSVMERKGYSIEAISSRLGIDAEVIAGYLSQHTLDRSVLFLFASVLDVQIESFEISWFSLVRQDVRLIAQQGGVNNVFSGVSVDNRRDDEQIMADFEALLASLNRLEGLVSSLMEIVITHYKEKDRQ